MKKSDSNFGVSDAILPLLDITLLLLGLFMILFAVSTSQKAADATAEANEKVTTQQSSNNSLPGHVIAVKILKDGWILLKSSAGESRLRNHEFPGKIQQLKQTFKTAIFLLQVEDPWDKGCNELYTKCLLDLKKNKASYSRVYP